MLNRIKVQRGTPKTACCDTRREFSSKAMVPSAYQNGVRIGLCRPGKPTDNAFDEEVLVDYSIRVKAIQEEDASPENSE